MKQYIKIITFDLSKEELKKSGFEVTFPLSMKPYNMIEAEMKRLGFEHLQKSVYKSKSVMSKIGLTYAVEELTRNLSWFSNCISKIHTADVINEKAYDLKEIVTSANILHRNRDKTPSAFVAEEPTFVTADTNKDTHTDDVLDPAALSAPPV
ncbi:hypothetical protein FACS1894133_3430 [Clostridia bacterium]|nr:hypothetical protein FACS1894133_3430 [Clostridia bacterium]